MIVKLCIFISFLRFGYLQLVENPFDFGYEPTPCSRWRPGDADLNTFDLIREFHLDEASETFNTMTRTTGSNQYQTAYSLTRETNLTMQAYEAFPRGIPHQFSFESTYRSRERSVEPWYLFHLSNAYEESQMYVKVDPSSYTLEVSLPMITGELQTVEFESRTLFDPNWHKVMIAVTHDFAALWVDCQPVRYDSESYTAKLETRGYLDTSAGYVSVARFAESSVLSAPSPEVDLQWMVISCDPTRPTKENCDELPSYAAAGVKPDLPSAPGPQQSCDVVCPRGPPGFNGTNGLNGSPGPRGLIGLTGLTGPRGKAGPRGPPGQPGASFAAKGEKGERGEIGLPGVGVPGQKGEAAFAAAGIKGEKGDTGERGVQGERGMPGLPGESVIIDRSEGGTVAGPQGPRGEPGPMGPQGLPGLPGAPGYSYTYQGERNNDLEALGYMQQAGPQGERGPQGPPGERGFAGPPGKSGQNGPPGRTISDGEIRNICLGVVREELMVFERVGPPGPPGKNGSPGRGYPGEPGPQGATGAQGMQGNPGHEGPRGSPGPQGDKGDRGQDGVGRDGTPGIPGLQGPVGPPGEEGHGIPGRNGEPGPVGPRGPPGASGDPGTCPMDCMYAAQAYMVHPQMSKGPPAYSMKGPPAYSIKG